MTRALPTLRIGLQIAAADACYYDWTFIEWDPVETDIGGGSDIDFEICKRFEATFPVT